MSVEFKFEVGEFVVSRFAYGKINTADHSELLRETYQVVERSFIEGEFGYEIAYTCRPQDYIGSKELLRLAEIELVALPNT